MTDRAQLERRVAELAAGPGFTLAPAVDGFDVHRDPLNARWQRDFTVGQASQTVVHHVTVDDARSVVTIADDVKTVAWQAGTAGPVPYLVVSASGFRGRLVGHGGQKTYAWRNGHLEKVDEVSYDVGEGRELVRTAARELGYTERAGTSQRIGLVAAIIGGAAAVITLVAVAVVFLL